MKRNLTLLVSMILCFSHTAYAFENNHEIDLGGSLLVTPYGASIGPSLSARVGTEWFRGGLTANAGVVLAAFGAAFFTVQPEIYVGPKQISLHVGGMLAAALGAGGGASIFLSTVGIESELTPHIRVHADVYHPVDLDNLWFPTFGARILGPEKRMFVDVSLIVTRVDEIPVIPSFTVGTRF